MLRFGMKMHAESEILAFPQQKQLLQIVQQLFFYAVFQLYFKCVLTIKNCFDTIGLLYETQSQTEIILHGGIR